MVDVAQETGVATLNEDIILSEITDLETGAEKSRSTNGEMPHEKLPVEQQRNSKRNRKRI